MTNPLEIIIEEDNGLYEIINEAREYAFNEGVLSSKNKLLIGIALDAAKGSEAGVRSLAIQAIEKGATKSEIMEAIRVAYFIDGAGSVYTAARGLSGVFSDLF